MKYIDAGLLRKEIERQKHMLKTSIQSGGDYGQSCTIVAYDNVLSIIDSLQQEQPEVDLEKEIEEHVIYMPHGEFASDNERQEDVEWAKKEFRHFYELGRLNTRKEE